MAQPSVASYFNTRKRSAVDEFKITRARKLLHQDNSLAISDHEDNVLFADKNASKQKTLPLDTSSLNAKIIHLKNQQNESKTNAKKTLRSTKSKKVIEDTQDIKNLLGKMITKEPRETIILESDPVPMHKTPPTTPVKNNAMDNVKLTGKEMSIKDIRQKLSRSNRLAELKASMARFNDMDAKLKVIDQKIQKADSPGLKSFKSIELEVHLSPVKQQSPVKQYLSPRKDSTVKKNLLNLLSPSKNAIALPKTENKHLTTEKSTLTLPFKYRTLAEMFRSIDTICQIMHNRKETITFKKLKPAVEELIKRNLTEKFLGQIKHIFPDAFSFRQEKIRAFGAKAETWELVIEPSYSGEAMTSDVLLERRRLFFKILIDKVKIYHQEFLNSLEPPLVVDSKKLTRWHPEFDIEKVPDIQCDALPQPPKEDKLTTGKDVLERAKLMFNCNTRMEAALERLKNAQEKKSNTEEQIVPETPKEMPSSLLKGIPKSLLEKVRQRQAAKALESMTRSDERDKEIQVYSHLPELARLTRNLFVSEKRSVLLVEVVVDKLTNSIRIFMKKDDIEKRLKLIEKEVPGWLMFHNIRNQNYIKIAKDADLSLVQHKLEKILKQKQAV